MVVVSPPAAGTLLDGMPQALFSLAWDKVKMAKMGRQELFPVYMIFGNVELDVKSSPESWLLVALLPCAWVFSTKKE